MGAPVLGAMDPSPSRTLMGAPVLGAMGPSPSRTLMGAPVLGAMGPSDDSKRASGAGLPGVHRFLKK